MTLSPLSDHLREIIQIARRAGDVLVSHDPSRAKVQTKGDGSPVSAADEEADLLIRSALERLDPRIPCISEENSLVESEIRRSWRRFWLVDPLDGTKEFLSGRSDYTVNIALIDGGIPTMGVVYAPRRGEMYYAETGQGAWRERSNEAAVRIRCKASKPGDALVSVESHSHPSPELEGFLSSLNIKERLRMGSSIKFCMVADGTADFYARFGPTMEWDVAAGDCVFRCALESADSSGMLTYNKPDLRNGSFVIGPLWLRQRALRKP